jgi:hypothetical protein
MIRRIRRWINGWYPLDLIGREYFEPSMAWDDGTFYAGKRRRVYSRCVDGQYMCGDMYGRVGIEEKSIRRYILLEWYPYLTPVIDWLFDTPEHVLKARGIHGR